MKNNSSPVPTRYEHDESPLQNTISPDPRDNISSKPLNNLSN